jgi:branched-subunit amino acid ABC-type transport system permease component
MNISAYTLGLLFIVCVAIIWSISSVVVQYLYHNTKFDAPFLLTYISTSLFVIQGMYLILSCFVKNDMILRQLTRQLLSIGKNCLKTILMYLAKKKD